MMETTDMVIPSERDLKNLLTSWKLDNLLPHLIAEKVDVNILEMMKIAHIRLLLHNFPVGIQISFEHNLEQWRREIGKPIQFSMQHYDERNTVIIKESLAKSKGYFSEAINNIDSEKVVSDQKIPSETQISQPSKTNINVRKILLQCEPDGSEILKGYDEQKKFSPPERKHLINTLINYYLENDKEFNLQMSYDLENAIMEIFPSERLDMYRKTKIGLLFKRYIALKSLHNKHSTTEGKFEEKHESNDKHAAAGAAGGHRDEHETSSNGQFSDNVEDSSIKNLLKPIDTLMENKVESSLPKETLSENTANENNKSQDITKIILHTIYNDRRKFVKILQPFAYDDFLKAACTIFNISNIRDHYVLANDCELSAVDFKNVILQYYKIPTFSVEIKENASQRPQLTKVEHCENSCFSSNNFSQSNVFSVNAAVDNSSVQIIYNHLPNANEIRNLPSLFPIVKISDDGKTLENKHRTAIAKALIDECLNFQPERILKRQDFFTLTDNIMHAFPKEVASAYYIPSQANHAARGKLWNAYNNKRAVFGNSGIVQRRQINVKRKHLSDHDDESEKTMDKVFITENIQESEDFSLNSKLDWNSLPQKWSDCHRERYNELMKQKISPRDYMNKYSILKSARGIDLMEIDVNTIYPTVSNINNWLSMYDKVLEAARKVRKIEMVPRLIDAIDNSNDEKYRASLALLLISFIFPYNSRKNDVNGERASKSEIQDRFIKEYETMEDLNSDLPCAELQIRFVHQPHQITYAEFNIGGFVFKCTDLLEATSSCFHYIMAMNMEYPKMCMHVWQFVQWAIFQIEVQDYKLPNVESTINDLYMN